MISPLQYLEVNFYVSNLKKYRILHINVQNLSIYVEIGHRDDHTIDEKIIFDISLFH